MPKRINRLGHRYGRLLVTGLVGSQGHGVQWECRCDCGIVVVKVGSDLGKVRSCGCLHAEVAAENMRNYDRRGRTPNRRHGQYRTPEYRTWVEMRRRCRATGRDNERVYRGVQVCERWNSFEAFLSDVGRKPSPSHTIDRWPNGAGDYEPGNVRWATKLQQSQNSRQVWLLDINDQRIGVKEMARTLALPRWFLYEHFKRVREQRT
jgi:hypothetical protein